jgi:hypothetical protein
MQTINGSRSFVTEMPVVRQKHQQHADAGGGIGVDQELGGDGPIEFDARKGAALDGMSQRVAAVTARRVVADESRAIRGFVDALNHRERMPDTGSTRFQCNK